MITITLYNVKTCSHLTGSGRVPDAEVEQLNKAAIAFAPDTRNLSCSKHRYLQQPRGLAWGI